jgi:hypothetical protein
MEPKQKQLSPHYSEADAAMQDGGIVIGGRFIFQGTRTTETLANNLSYHIDC